MTPPTGFVRCFKHVSVEKNNFLVVETVNRVRAEEVRVLLKATMLRAVNEAMFFVQPAVISCMVFATYHLLGNVLEPQQVCPPHRARDIHLCRRGALRIASPRPGRWRVRIQTLSMLSTRFVLLLERVFRFFSREGCRHFRLCCPKCFSRFSRGARSLSLFLPDCWNRLGRGQVFTTVALLNITQFTMGKFLYLAVQTTSESWVSIKRMETILLMEVGGWLSLIVRI